MAEKKKVFEVVQDAATVIVIPQGDTVSFRYNDIHLESNRILRLLDDASVKNVIIDFGDTNYASSVVIGALIRVARKATNQGGQSVICSVTERMRDILTTMNLFQLWPSHSTREEALAALAESRS